MIDLRLLRIFVTVARFGNMTSAARELGLTQSAVSQSVRQLEELLGTVLVDRERRPIALTPAGSLLDQRGKRLLEDACTLFTTVRETASQHSQEIRIGLLDSFAATVGTGLIRTLGATAVRLSVLSGLAFELGEAFASRRLDMLVTSDPMAGADGVERNALLREPFVMLLPASHADLRELPLACIARALPLVRFNRGSHIAAQIDLYLERQGIAAARRYEIDSAENLTAMVATNPLWAITTPLCLLQARHWRADVVIAPLPDATLGRTVYLLAREGEYGELPARVATMARTLFAEQWMPVVRDLMPWVDACWPKGPVAHGDAASNASTTSRSSQGPRSQLRSDVP